MIATFLANNIIKKKNQPKSLLYREGYIEVEREEVTGFWEYLWQNLYAGMTHSLIHTEKKKKRKVKLYKKKRDLIQMYN